jgi:hypothetical protein
MRMTGAGDRRPPGTAAIIGAMAVLPRACAPLVLGLLVGCGSDDTAVPAGTYTTTITAADQPRSSRSADGGREFVLTTHAWAPSGS